MFWANFLMVSQQVLILFLMMGLGVVLRRTGLLERRVVDGLVDLLLLVVTPCQIVEAFMRPYDVAAMKGLEWALGLSIASYLAMIALAYILIRNRDVDTRHPLRMAAVFSNAGTLAIPLEKALFGNEGVFYSVIYMAVQNLFIWTWGYGTMKKSESVEHGRRGNAARLQAIANPGTIGIAIGLPIFLFSISLPSVVGEPIHQIANLNAPLGMIVIGCCLETSGIVRMLRTASAFLAVVLRLAVCPLLMVLLIYPFRHRLDSCLMLALVAAASAPVAATVSMFAVKFDRHVGVSVALVSGTTLASVLSMPLAIAFARMVFE